MFSKVSVGITTLTTLNNFQSDHILPSLSYQHCLRVLVDQHLHYYLNILDFSHSNVYIAVFHAGFDLHFSKD